MAAFECPYIPAVNSPRKSTYTSSSRLVNSHPSPFTAKSQNLLSPPTLNIWQCLLNVIGKGLECSTVLVFPPGKSLQAQVCASRLFGFVTVYRTCADERAAKRGSREELWFPGILTGVDDSGGGCVPLTPEVGYNDMMPGFTCVL
jgi:hypothetical protein